jgi:hypothetical protein
MDRLPILSMFVVWYEHQLTAPLTGGDLSGLLWRHDIQHNGTQHNDIQHNDIQHNDTQHNNK